MSVSDAPKGSVVVIDEEHPGKLKLSDQAYDTRVAGIVSGANGINPGISLNQEGVSDAARTWRCQGGSMFRPMPPPPQSSLEICSRLHPGPATV